MSEIVGVTPHGLASTTHHSPLTTHQWGMLAFLFSEVAFFSTLVMTYLALHDRDRVGPTPAEALSLPLVIGTTICLLSSSFTVHVAERALRQGRQGAFCLWWGATALLGIVFLLGTGYEWHELYHHHHLTPSRNLFGTAYYTVVGFHGLHVTAGVIALLLVLDLARRNLLTARNAMGAELVSWYWHFVDAVWIVVFTVVYIVCR
jgi:cytochrome c oxidase subunit III